MPEDTGKGGFELMRIIINLGALGVGAGIVALIVATIVSGT